jgi:tRNA(fMet)-specific endonuclease VapC
MIARLALDTNAMIELLRPQKPDPQPLREAGAIFLPLPVLGELYTGVYISTWWETNLAALDAFLPTSSVIRPDEHTARLYGQLRARHRLENIGVSKMNDVWIAALCIQNDLPLLTNDHAFRSFPDLRVIGW